MAIFNSYLYVYRRVIKQVVLNPAEFHASKGPDRVAEEICRERVVEVGVPKDQR